MCIRYKKLYTSESDVCTVYTSDSDVYSRSPHWKKNISNGRRPPSIGIQMNWKVKADEDIYHDFKFKEKQ